MLKICLTGNGYTEKHLSLLSNKGFEVFHEPQHMSSQTLQHILPDYDAYVLGGDERLTEVELKTATKLSVISFVGTGYTSFIDEIAAKRLSIAIKNTPAVMAPAVVEHTLGMLIGLQRNLFQQNWQAKNSLSEVGYYDELSSKRVGIIGLGEIGSRLAKILKNSFNSDVIYNSRTRKIQIEAELDITFSSLDGLLTTSDIILLALPTTAETEYFINESLINKMKDGVIIINTAGARLIQPEALKKYIDNNKIAAAAFDGYYIEPLPLVKNDPFGLLSLPDNRFIVTPHTAAKTAQSWNRMLDMAINNVIHFFHE